MTAGAISKTISMTESESTISKALQEQAARLDAEAAELRKRVGEIDEMTCKPCIVTDKSNTSFKPHGRVGTAEEAFMLASAASAMAGVRCKHGGPFGASVVRDGVIISCAHNMVLYSKDPTKHAEMNAIQQACLAIGSYDLSDCELYTTCEPCPMCWGAIQWSRLGTVYLGVDRTTAAKYGFDDKVFYDEIDNKAGHYGVQRYGFNYPTTPKTSKTCQDEHLVQVYHGILHDEATALFANPLVNRTMRRRFGPAGAELRKAYSEVFVREDDAEPAAKLDDAVKHEEFMRMAIAAAEHGAKKGRSKEREPFGVVIVKNGVVISEAHNMVMESRDATATAEVTAIRAAAVKLGTHNLEGCVLYGTAHPDLMSLGAILWARIERVYCGVTQQLAAQYGFEDGLMHFRDLLEVANNEKSVNVVEAVAKDECEAVFQEWSDLNGVIY